MESLATLTPTKTLPPPTSTPEGFQPSGFTGGDCVDASMEISEATLVRVTDGDTIVVDIDGAQYEVRYIGIDAPEGGQVFGSEASALNAELVQGNDLILIKDISETDRFGRLLRYVFSSEHFVNYEMIARGSAWASNYPPDEACAAVFAGAQEAATVAKLGVWENAAPTIAPQVSGSGCDPSYPTVCIPSPPPDLDCGDIGFRRFAVQGADPHHFDGDRDGVGCES